MNREYNSKVSSKNSKRFALKVETYVRGLLFAAPCILCSPLIIHNIMESHWLRYIYLSCNLQFCF